MASAGAIWGPATLRLLRIAASKTTRVIRTKLSEATRPLQYHVQHAPARSGFASRQPIHPAAQWKQYKRGAKWLSSNTAKNINNVLRRFMSSEPASAARFGRGRLPTSNTSRRVAQFSGRAPFATTLRPNLTGGAMPRTAGGYSLGGGGARYFSHAPAAQAQVVHNVSQAVRAFFFSGQKIRYDGVGPRGDRKYRAVSKIEDEAIRKLADIPRSQPGSFIDFRLSPTMTALSPLAAAITYPSETAHRAVGTAAPASLNTPGFLDVLSADFGRALHDLTSVYADLRRLAVLGDLPIVQEKNDTLRVRFPGVDAATVEQLCNDFGIERGIVGQDPDFDLAVGVPVALKFPFAPDSRKALTSPGGSERSLESLDFDSMSSSEADLFVRESLVQQMEENPWLSDPEGYETMSSALRPAEPGSEEFEGLEGIYRFLEECDRGRGRLG
ncbi:hypothetical protein RJ55_06149 [Drechmeria coniospora]|nr:hypothetical protein RJ55_06149 [Drechmeria coniospora]